MVVFKESQHRYKQFRKWIGHGRVSPLGFAGETEARSYLWLEKARLLLISILKGFNGAHAVALSQFMAGPWRREEGHSMHEIQSQFHLFWTAVWDTFVGVHI
jgi:hypothetical protein